MCQKAFGAFYAPLVGIEKGAELTWTRGEPAYFQSSNHVHRGFCRDCGTPLTYEAPDGLGLAIGAFDHPQEIVPTVQYGVEGKLPYADRLTGLPGTRSEEDEIALPFLATMVSYQHPDEDTDSWPQGEQQ
ncbi:GFA family protein [Labrenzia aggregata]|uniref:GFA family protein n=2 Tax=Roseibium aggregatum TaxID=187304 RepID=A0A926NSJ3_9HYPH|nr:GFA family protein [Roseibium aggregatum]